MYLKDFNDIANNLFDAKSTTSSDLPTTLYNFGLSRENSRLVTTYDLEIIEVALDCVDWHLTNYNEFCVILMEKFLKYECITAKDVLQIIG